MKPFWVGDSGAKKTHCFNFWGSFMDFYLPKQKNLPENFFTKGFILAQSPLMKNHEIR
jgi:hypothetical protein